MPRIAIVLLAGTGTPTDLGRMVNALETAVEAIAADDELRIVFDGAGTTWIPALADPDHVYNGLYKKVKPHITGACQYCAGAYGVKQAVLQEEIPLLGEHRGHPSLRTLVADGFAVLTF
jgi:hypothetical protein